MEFSSYWLALSSKTTLSITLLTFSFFLSKVLPTNGFLDDDNTRMFHVFEMRIGINEFNHCILAMHRHHRGQGSNPRSGLSCSSLSSAKMP